jgi:hypothetical protein
VTIRTNLQTDDEQNRDGKVLMLCLLHMGAHAAVWQPGKPQTVEGRYHSAEFRDIARALGLDADQPMRARRPSAGSGYGDITLARAPTSRSEPRPARQLGPDLLRLGDAPPPGGRRGQAERGRGMLGKQLRPVARQRSKLGLGRVQVVDPASAQRREHTPAIFADRSWSGRTHT